MSRVKPADVQFYVDADILGLARVLAALRSDVTYPGDPGAVVHKRQRPACPVTRVDTLDHVWIPEVTRRGCVIITRDSAIQGHRREIDAVREHGARMVALVGRDARGTFEQLEVVMSHWRRITRCVDEVGPFIYAVTRTTFRQLAL